MYKNLYGCANASVLQCNGHNALRPVHPKLSFNTVMLFGQRKGYLQLKCLWSTAHSFFWPFYMTVSTAKTAYCEIRHCRITIKWKEKIGSHWSWPILRCYSKIHKVRIWTCESLPAAVNYTSQYKTREVCEKSTSELQLALSCSLTLSKHDTTSTTKTIKK